MNAVASEMTVPPARARDQQRERVLLARQRRSAQMTVVLWGAAIVAVVPLLAIVVYLIAGGASAFSLKFLTRMPTPSGVPGGGMANGIAGTMLLIGVGSLLGVPVGIGAGLYAAERATTRLAHTVRFVAEVLSGVPSIVLGVFVWELLVRPVGRFSALAGGVALGLLIVPLVMRATEEMVKLVPVALAEAAMALGFSRWRTSLQIVLRTATPGIATAALVAIARAAGETAPLLFTAFGNSYWSLDLLRPIAALPLQIFAYAQSPYDDWRAQAMAGALVLLILITVMSLLARSVLRARARLTAGVRGRSGVPDADGEV